MNTTAPLQVTQRAAILDVLRGFALLGIFIANLFDFNFYWIIDDAQKAALPLAEYDKTASFLQRMFVEGKFYSLFSLLFGIGFAIFLAKPGNEAANLAVFRRRLLVLLGIGFIHLLLWTGDIVFFYALLGFLLIPFRKLSNKTLLILAALCILSPIAWYALKMSNPEVFDLSRWLYKADEKMQNSLGLKESKDFYHVFQGNDLWLRTKSNFYGITWRYGSLFFQSRLFKVFGMFLIGLVVGRSGFYKKLKENRRMLASIILAGFAIGLPANYLLARLQANPGYDQLTMMGLKQTIAYAIGVAPLALAYAASIALLYLYAPFQKTLALLAPQGRMALTNYLMQTLIGIITFSQLGFGFPSLGPAAWTLFAVGIFFLQVIISTIWLRYFQYGPMEWIWRQLTYGKRLPLKINKTTTGIPSHKLAEVL
jgi:uncharacterized protein